MKSPRDNRKSDSQPIVFRQWARKSWAVFRSLGKKIKIGKLKTTVSEGFIQTPFCSVIIDFLHPKIFDEDDFPPEKTNRFLAIPEIHTSACKNYEHGETISVQKLNSNIKSYTFNRYRSNQQRYKSLCA
jgi:hypothetical protein